jgi:hypothetical protein
MVVHLAPKINKTKIILLIIIAIAANNKKMIKIRIVRL